MSTTTLLTIFIPAVLGFVMFGIGVSLKREDFRRVLEQPRAVAVGLFCQMIVLPIVAFLISLGFGLSAPYAVGLMILAAFPGGSTANLFSHLTGGHVALNVTLTAVSSIVSILSVPLIIQWSLLHFLQKDTAVDVETGKLMHTVFMVMVPMIVGMAVAEWRPAIRDRLKSPVQVITILLLIALVVGSMIKEKDKLMVAAQIVGGAVLVFNIVSLIFGYFIPKALSLSQRDAIAVTFEVGIHNGAVAMALAANPMIVSVVRSAGFNITDFSVAFPAAAYVIIMNLSGGLLICWFRRRLN